MDATTEAAIRAFLRLHSTTEAVFADPNHPGAETSLQAAATEANQLMREAGLLGQPEHVIYGLVRELVPTWKPATNPDRQLSALLIPTGPLDRAPSDPRFRHTGQLTTGRDRQLILRAVLSQAGVQLGDHDERVLTALAEEFEWGTFATVASWIQRAAESTSR
ncbi:hypothetical protein ACFY4B_41955 [Kitasatospora sp. NPDC001261]|uniref:hypothetical protein n=1 Tax=Kitasatospora sp. NPDC001261 TaxID=3364012 RepID=UPI00367CED77